MSQPTPLDNKQLADGNRQDKRHKRQLVGKPVRLPRNEKLGNLFKRLVTVSEALEHQLQRNGFQVGDWKSTKELAHKYIEILLVKGGELPEPGLQPSDEALEEFLLVSSRGTTCVPTAIPPPPISLEPTSNPQLDMGKPVSPSGYVDRGFDFGDDDRGFDPSIADWVVDEDPVTIERSTKIPILLDQTDSENSSIADDSEARRGKKEK